LFFVLSGYCFGHDLPIAAGVVQLKKPNTGGHTSMFLSPVGMCCAQKFSTDFFSNPEKIFSHQAANSVDDAIMVHLCKGHNFLSAGHNGHWNIQLSPIYTGSSGSWSYSGYVTAGKSLAA
jgi:hypothetical protein